MPAHSGQAVEGRAGWYVASQQRASWWFEGGPGRLRGRPAGGPVGSTACGSETAQSGQGGRLQGSGLPMPAVSGPRQSQRRPGTRHGWLPSAGRSSSASSSPGAAALTSRLFSSSPHSFGPLCLVALLTVCACLFSAAHHFTPAVCPEHPLFISPRQPPRCISASFALFSTFRPLQRLAVRNPTATTALPAPIEPVHGRCAPPVLDSLVAPLASQHYEYPDGDPFYIQPQLPQPATRPNAPTLLQSLHLRPLLVR